jgi:ADP-heptose:LPS heptosyltransferase
MSASSLLVPGVQKIAVLRPNAVGDFVFALPALHALRAAYPAAWIVYLGLPWHAQFLAARPSPVDEVRVMPPWPGICAPVDAQLEPEPLLAFVDALRAERFDLALQMFGGGRHANPFIQSLGARVTVGMCAADAVPLERSLAYRAVVNRRLQLLELAALAGARFWPMERELALTDDDREQAAEALPPDPRPLVVLQPGASDPRRRWPVERFAALGDLLAQQGALVAVNGSADEAGLAGAVVAAMRAPAVDLSGKVSLAALCGLLERAALLVSNDTGPLHLALALGAPCVGIYWLTNLIESAPLRQERHRAALSVRVHCPQCGAENLSTRCAHDASFVADVPVEEVAALARELFGGPDIA